MYIAKGLYNTTKPALTKFEALVQLLISNYIPVIIINNSWQVTLKADGYDPFAYLYSTEWTPYNALKDAVLCHYKKFGIRLFKEI